MLSLLTLLSCLTSPKEYKVLLDAALDYDQDGYVSAEHPEEGGDDCDDERPETYPGAIELCDGLDNNCDGTIDEGVTELAGLYHDRDRDSYGGEAVAVCPLPEDVSSTPGDCDDNNGAINPLATDVVGDGRDQNCDGLDGTDGDGDGFASVATGGTDCDDMNATAYLGAEEACYDLLDNDCDVEIDEGESEGCVASDMLMITEFNNLSTYAHPLGEWIEIYNFSDYPLNLKGLVVEISHSSDATPPFTITSDVIVMPTAFAVLCFSRATLNETCDFEYGDNAKYSSGDTSIPNMAANLGNITIRSNGTEVLNFGYYVGASSMFPPAADLPASGGYSLEFPFIGGLPDTDETSPVWCRNTTDVFYTFTEDGVDYFEYGTPGAPNTCTKE